MYKLTGTIEGLAPLLFSRPYKVIEGKAPGKTTDEDRDEEPTKRLHVDPERGAYIPQGAFKASLLEGIRLAGIKDGKRSAVPLIEATTFPQHHLYLGKSTFDEVLRVPARVPPRTGSLVMISYPQFNVGWSAAFTLIVAQDSRTLVDNIRAGLEAAGLLVGLGSWRPEHGRFVVREWKAAAVS